MNEWLYGKNGYYNNIANIGKKGDFYTSVSASMFFGGSIANHLIQNIHDGILGENIAVVEIGANEGLMLADMIQFIFTLKPSLLKSLKFIVVEPIASLQEYQRRYFKDSFGDFVDVKIVKTLDEIKEKEAFVVANELFDAFVCEVIYDDKMLFIHDKKAVFKKITDKKIKQLCEQQNIQKGEISLGFESFAKSLNRSFEKYYFISFDYGQMSCRDDFSLRIYSHHEVYSFFSLTQIGGFKDSFDDFFAKSDITYDVNFLHLKNAFLLHGAKMQRFCTQMAALSDFGIASLLEILHTKVDEKTYSLELEKAKRLILPNFLGERFKMINFTKNI